MSQPPYVPPKRDAKAYNCPLCHAYATQIWEQIGRVQPQKQAPRLWHVTGVLDEYRHSTCFHCRRSLLWHGNAIIVPDVGAAPAPNADLAEDIKTDYAEAASIAAKSPRGAAALLRLCLQKLCKQLGEKGKSIDADIGALVKKGLDVRIQQALDTVRVIGNEAVHPGELDLRDERETVATLFALLNAIANDMITQPRLREAMYSRLPQSKRDAIEQRDAKARTQGEGTGEA